MSGYYFQVVLQKKEILEINRNRKKIWKIIKTNNKLMETSELDLFIFVFLFIHLLLRLSPPRRRQIHSLVILAHGGHSTCLLK